MFVKVLFFITIKISCCKFYNRAWYVFWVPVSRSTGFQQAGRGFMEKALYSALPPLFIRRPIYLGCDKIRQIGQAGEYLSL